MATQREIADQMLAQLRVLDPSVSAELGTPERKIIDTVAQALSDAQIDLSILSGALDVDAKIGSNLDNFLSLFGFGRQQAIRATGYVTFGRDTPSTADVFIPTNTQVYAPAGGYGQASSSQFLTQTGVILKAGETSVAAPIRAVVSGSFGNVAAGTISHFSGSPVFGVTNVTNPLPTSGGLDNETDDEIKIRFRETVFRNLAGTADQILALAVATKFTTKVNVVGPISRYREYIQVPSVDDTVSENVNPPSQDTTPDSPGTGIPGRYTAALSTVPYSQHTYESVPAFVSNGQTGADAVFYREGVDWLMNTTASGKAHGDAERFYNAALPDSIDPTSEAAANIPNVTFLNVYTGGVEAVSLLRPEQVVLFEHSYLSTASRNNIARNVTNAIDVFIDGGNTVFSSTIVPAPGTTPTNVFNNTATSAYYRLNYRRDGVAASTSAPVAGHLFIPLFWQPVVDVPSSITITGTIGDTEETATFYRNTNYWFVEDITNDLRGTVRARNGLEWDIASNSPTSEGISLSDFPEDSVIQVNDYGYDQNVIDIQAALESSKQVTTDILVHKAKTRYFKLDVTVMYSGGFNATAVNSDIQSAISAYFGGLYFGSAIQLSDLLQVIHGVPGVDNVRWTSDLPNSNDLSRVVESDIFGNSGEDVSHDFFLRDDELAALPPVANTNDTVPGLRIRARAQNTWIKA